ncbi:uncharacterized protein LOC130414452 [Triplophysa dalaica]|uniref:uncharacterized protein LOC130414452 n=1 Tax=Triplophysa dalaica TaxID=1582913 RepID=UPI0024E02FC4|nr:uncharacterized protein LOC130414452 [Triplophysa dalaica]
MTLKSHCTHQRTPTEFLWNNAHILKPYNSKSKHHYLTQTHPMDQRRPKPHRFHSCLMFRLKGCVRMDQRPCGGDVQGENTESRLRELALKWFTETQAPLILHNGNFPEWFQGFISRKDAEEHLKDKKLGCFLIRLSDKATGYILSYKGRDRCRHFVINQHKDGRFIVTGDTEMHDSLTSLIEFYKIRPIEPFGEYLTSSCFESSTSELYDVIHVEQRGQAALSVKAMKNIWDHQYGKPDEILQPPALPPKGNRNMQVAPPLPRKGPPVKTSSLEAKDNVLYTQVEMQNYKERARSPTEGRNFSLTEPLRIHKSITGDQGTVYSELIVPNCRSQSLPLLDDNTEDDSHFNRQNSPTKGLPSISTSLGKLCNTSLYQLAGTPGNQITTRQKESTVNTHEPTYTEVPPKPFSNDIENTYEQIPDSRLEARALENSTHTNTYETLMDIKPKPINSARAVKAEKWKWLNPEYWKK